MKEVAGSGVSRYRKKGRLSCDRRIRVVPRKSLLSSLVHTSFLYMQKRRKHFYSAGKSKDFLAGLGFMATEI
ncbi:hypothetical protein B5F37_00415 [Drancourtella sp. An210]|nr:hypothetical protein B5F37_00415 [Drancourtella sp. An210]OUP65565.1 hypothetical protein B5F13_05950 [Drancourtella sp. An177]